MMKQILKSALAFLYVVIICTIVMYFVYVGMLLGLSYMATAPWWAQVIIWGLFGGALFFIPSMGATIILPAKLLVADSNSGKVIVSVGLAVSVIVVLITIIFSGLGMAASGISVGRMVMAGILALVPMIIMMFVWLFDKD